MDSHNGNQTNRSQNELDLGLNADKTTAQDASFLGKAKGLFGKKEQAQPQFHVRKEPTFGMQNDAPQATAFSANPVNESIEEPEIEEPELNVEEPEVLDEKPFTSQNAKVESLKQPEKWKILQMLPEKHRRLFIALFGLVVLLIIFFSLKPSSDTVESFEQQNSNEIPVQFQSLDQSQPVETTVLDNVNAPAAPSEATTNEASSTPPAMEYMGDNAAANPQPASQAAPEPVVPAVPAVAPAPKAVEKAPQPVAEHKPQAVERPVQQVQKEVARKPEPVAKAQPSVKKEVAKVPVVEAAKPAVKEQRKVEIVDAKSASAKAAEKAASAAPAPAAAGSKTLTVPQGVTLMQVFRDNKLNISDVNAMTKANGAGNALSSFKPGDKVQVSLNGQGRVSELRLSNGAKFIRQADGSYQYKK